jgi:hypothetical protein
MEEASPRDVRTERLLRIAVRLVFYPCAVGLIALAWHQHHGGPANARQRGVERWRGVTSQGLVLRASTQKGMLVFLDVVLRAPCSDGSLWTFHWTPGPNRFTQIGTDLRGRAGPEPNVSYSGEAAVVDTQVRAQMGAQPRGTLLTEAHRGHRGVFCSSGRVTFALHHATQ